MYHKKSERGQALILIAFAMIGLVGFTALTIDGGRALSDRRNAQNAADSAALAAAYSKVNGGNYATVAEARANSNGYPNNIVDVNLCSETGITCAGVPSTATTAVKAQYIRVRITSVVNTTFAKVIGRSQVTNVVEAVARVTTGTSTSSSSGPLYGGAAMVATKGGNNNQCFLMNGGANVYTHNSGIYVNCSGSQALFANGGAVLDMDAAGQIVGGYGINGGAMLDPITTGVNGGVSLPINATTFADVPTTQSPPMCDPNHPFSPCVTSMSPPHCDINGSISGTGTSLSGTNANISSGATGTFSPGNFGDITINGSGATGIFNPGIYCITGNFNLNGNSSMSGPSGRVIFVLQNQNIVMNGGSVINFNDLEIYGNNASFLLNGNAIFRATRLRLFLTGSGTFTVNGGSELTSSNAYIYLNTGNITWNGSSILNLHAAPAGDPFAGLLVYMPWNSTTSGVIFNGGSNIHLTGTFLAPNRPVTFNGGVNFELHSQIIGYTYIVNGGTDVDIYYVASENYNPTSTSAPDPTIELTQ